MLATLPSGSALEQSGNLIFVVSDDAPYIYRCNLDGKPVDSIHLRHLPADQQRIPKPVKPDYEAAISGSVNGQEYLVAFGSGSLRPQRDSAIFISISDPASQSVVPLSALYAAMRAHAGIAEDDFNIEAAALQENRLLLFNRGTNHMFTLDWHATAAHLMEGAPVPTMRAALVPLPKTGGYPTGISGACFLNPRHVLFCASVEATTNWISDGEVLGSFIGILALNGEGQPRLIDSGPVLNETGDTIKDKVEGIYHLGQPDKGSLSVLAIVDNDDGSSRLLRIRLTNLAGF
jgi:hypothetical protein